MLLILRLTITILFSAFVLYSQTLDADFRIANNTAGATAPEYKLASLTLDGNSAQVDDRHTFKLYLDRVSTADLSSGFSEEGALPQLKSAGAAGPSVFSFDPQSASAQKPTRPRATNYTHAYMVRQKIHKYTSIATLPLFVSELIVGEKLRNDTDRDSSLRSAHSALAAGMGVLFGVESVTGVWNMLSSRGNPHGHKRRMIHGILMLAADAGFVATAATAPHRDENLGVRNDDVSTHRAIAYTSIGVATASYLYILIAR